MEDSIVVPTVKNRQAGDIGKVEAGSRQSKEQGSAYSNFIHRKAVYHMYNQRNQEMGRGKEVPCESGGKKDPSEGGRPDLRSHSFLGKSEKSDTANTRTRQKSSHQKPTFGLSHAFYQQLEAIAELHRDSKIDEWRHEFQKLLEDQLRPKDTEIDTTSLFSNHLFMEFLRDYNLTTPKGQCEKISEIMAALGVPQSAIEYPGGRLVERNLAGVYKNIAIPQPQSMQLHTISGNRQDFNNYGLVKRPPINENRVEFE
jgi:hypothetical protein